MQHCDDLLHTAEGPPATEFRCCEVPWGQGFAPQTTIVVLCATLPLSLGGATVASLVRGTPWQQFPASDQAAVFAASKACELALELIVFRSMLGQYGRSLQQQFRFKITPQSMGLALSAVVTVFCGNLLLRQLLSTPPSTSTAQARSLLEGGNVSSLIALTALATLLAPVGEELLYRGFLLPSLSRAMPKASAVLLSSAVFSATHFSARDFPALLLLGCCLGIATVADEGNLAAPLGAHVLYNGLLLAGLAANSR